MRFTYKGLKAQYSKYTVTDEDVTLSQDLLNTLIVPEINNPENTVDIEPIIPSEDNEPENIIENIITID